MAYETQLWEKASCSKKDRSRLIPVIEMITGFVEKAMKEGLLSLEDEIDGIDSQFIKKGLQLVVDGTDPELVRSILTTWIYAGGFSGIELLTRMAAADGILSIQAGYSINSVRGILCAYLGEDYEPVPVKDAAKIRNNGTNAAAAQPEAQLADNSGNIKQSRSGPEDTACMQKLTDILNSGRRIISNEPVSAEEIRSVSAAIQSSPRGIETFINLLRSQPAIISRNLLRGFELHSPEAYARIKEKMFSFEDLALCNNIAIQKILRETDTQAIAIAIKGASAVMREKILSNMSSRAAALLKEDMEFMGTVRLEDAEEAQNRITKIARKLEESGEILIPRPEEETV